MDYQAQNQRRIPEVDGDGRSGSYAGVLAPGSDRAWLILSGSLGLALAVYYGFLGSSLIEYVAEWTATWTSRGLNLAGASTRVNGTILASDSFAVNIVAECTAVGPLVLFIGAVMAYPSPLRSKTLGVLLGLVVLSLVNLDSLVKTPRPPGAMGG